MFKVLVTAPDYFPDEYLKSLDGVCTIVKKKLSREELLRQVADFDALLIRVDTIVDKEVLENSKNLKAVASATTGLNHVDLEYAEKKGVKVFSAPGVNATSAAEHTFALMSSLVKRIPWGFDSIKNGKWERTNFFGKQLEDKTIGIIGLGRIGKKIAKYASAFGMKILTYDPYITMESALEVGTQITSLEDLLKNSDFITINVALTAETKHIVNKESLNMMKKNAIVINTSRGDAVNEKDLLESLQNGTIAGAALDVFSEEPLTENNMLVAYSKNHDNLLLTPHIGGSTEESIRDACKYVVEKLAEFLHEPGFQSRQ